jgi:hypothetical protein
MSKKEKLRAQVKSRFYYLFWGAATVSVFAGQLYVGTGYRKMSESFDKIVGTVILELDPKPYPRHHGMMPDVWEDEGLYHPTDPPKRVY